MWLGEELSVGVMRGRSWQDIRMGVALIVDNDLQSVICGVSLQCLYLQVVFTLLFSIHWQCVNTDQP